MDNLETILEELEQFEKKAGSGTSKILEEYIQHVAKTGDTLLPWNRIRYFMRFMLASVMNDFYETCGGEDVSECGNVPAFSYAPTRDKILHHFDSFSGAPFTIQRLCEIMTDPTRHYKQTDKFLRGLEKNVLVVSHVEPGRQRRCEDPQQTLVNGMQDGGMHLSPLSGSSRLPSPHKRISSPQPTNSISNNSSDFYDSEINATESHITGSEANGPNGVMLEDRNLEASSENAEPPVKKCRTDLTCHIEKASGSVDRLSHLQDKENPYMSISEAESLEAEGSDEESNASSSSSSSAKTDEEAMETGEAEATCQSDKEENNKMLEETLCAHQVGTSENSSQESDVDEDATEACSSDISNAQESEESKDDNNSLSSESSGCATNQGSPDSIEDTSEHSQLRLQEEGVCRGERPGSSEATAAELIGATETDEVTEGGETAQSSQEEADKDSHEADSTSQAQSNNFCSQSFSSSVGSSTTTVTSCSPSTASTSASALSPVASPPSDAGAPTTSQISAPLSPQTGMASSAAPEESNVGDSPSVDDASTTCGLSELDGGEEASSNNDSNDSLEMGEEPSNDDASTSSKNANVSCSSSLADKSDDARDEPMDED
ncbi:protein phosphatase 4, regulatory subunit 2 [Halocaridina rubra]|uniref:Protein phosphatase 4, regulatory subunit 2 n=1 Tax=Halocaridina rubra TaxID=373956 RepID=A0AAN8X602_HALRR